MSDSFLPSLWSLSNQSLLGSRESALLCNQVGISYHDPDRGPIFDSASLTASTEVDSSQNQMRLAWLSAKPDPSSRQRRVAPALPARELRPPPFRDPFHPAAGAARPQADSLPPHPNSAPSFVLRPCNPQPCFRFAPDT